MATATELERLRTGNRLRYNRLQWQVEDYSTYQDPQGYATQEWRLRSDQGQAYYLLREVDPKTSQVEWYLSEEISKPEVFRPPADQNCVTQIARSMKRRDAPYPDLKAFYRNYFFESETEGSYRSSGETYSRRTWDYWDATHQWNLAFEYWEGEDRLVVYSARAVQPTDFDELDWSYREPSHQGFATIVQSPFFQDGRWVQIVLASVVMLLGVIFLLSGI